MNQDGDGVPYDVLIVGAGPAGLAAAIAAASARLKYLVLEKGSLVNSIFHFPKNMVFFTTPELLEIGGLPFTTPFEKPTRAEALRYYRRVVGAYNLSIALGEEALVIHRSTASGDSGHTLRVGTRRRDGLERNLEARTVILATGYYDHPNMLGIPGESLPHVSHYYTEAHAYYRKRVVVAGGKNSAAEAALELYRAGALVTLVHRRSQLGDSIKYWVRPDIENRIKEGSISARFDTRVLEIHPQTVLIENASGAREELPADGVFLLTGYHPDVDFLRAAGIAVEEGSCKPEHNPATLETNVPGIFLAGAIVSGKEANRIFIENGRFHGETVIKHIAARLRQKA